MQWDSLHRRVRRSPFDVPGEAKEMSGSKDLRRENANFRLFRSSCRGIMNRMGF